MGSKDQGKSDPNALMDELKKAHERAHCDDAGPSNEQEMQAGQVYSSFQKAVMGLIVDGADPSMIELALFYHWLRFITLIHRCTDSQFEHLSARMQDIMQALVLRLKEIASEITDDGPSENMKELGLKVQAIKDLFHQGKRKSAEDVHAQAEKINLTLFELAGSFLEAGLNPLLLQNALLYFWLRTSTINAPDADERLFQKLERNWPEVVNKVDEFFATWRQAN